MNLTLLPITKLNGALATMVGGVPSSDKDKVIQQLEHFIAKGLITYEQIASAKRHDVSTLNSNAVDLVALNQRLDSLDSRLNGLQVADWSEALRNEVAQVFSEFKTDVPVEQLAEIANQLPPVLCKKTVRELFDGVLSYEDPDTGLVIDFSGLEVDYWGDINAPTLVDDYIFNPQHLHQALLALSAPLPDNVWLSGERGTGKTEFVNQICARLGRKLFRVNFDEAMERSEFIGGNILVDGNVVWRDGVIAQAIQYTGAVILLDELGFARAQSIAVLHSVTEPSKHRALAIPETGARIPVASHVVFFCADNSNGHGDSSGNFQGVREQNSAFIDRFSYTLEFEYLPQAQEVALVHARTGLDANACDVLIKFANIAREKARSGILTQPPSLRQLFAWARAIKRGIPISVAFKTAIVSKFPVDCAPELDGIYKATIDVHNLKSFLVKG